MHNTKSGRGEPFRSSSSSPVEAAVSDNPLLKDLVDEESVRTIAAALRESLPELDEEAFVKAVFDDEWANRPLKKRIRHIAVTIHSLLPDDYAKALDIVCSTAETMGQGGIAAWCFNDFVEEYGVEEPDLSLTALEQLTQLASSEFAIRPFLQRYPGRVAEQMLEWAHHDSEHVRRLASEGFRPRLPWGLGVPALKKDPTPILPVLEELRDDPSETVRRSVANNLNDISKDHPEVVVSILRAWGAASSEARALRKHALRTLLKKGHPGALELLGFSKDVSVSVVGLAVQPKSAAVGEHVYIEFEVVSAGRDVQPVMIDYAVTYQNLSGTGSRKVFKGVVDELEPGQSTSLRRKVSLEPMSTRRILVGPHVVEAQVNGVVHAAVEFDVVE